jgi:hypothetical protein
MASQATQLSELVDVENSANGGAANCAAEAWVEGREFEVISDSRSEHGNASLER